MCVTKQCPGPAADLFLVGGINAKKAPVNSVWKFSTNANGAMWGGGHPLATARAYHGAAVAHRNGTGEAGYELYVVGGSTVANLQHAETGVLASVEVFGVAAP